MLFPAHIYCPPFISTVSIIRQRIPKKKMVWVNAQPIIASVADHLTRGDFTMMQNIRNAMCEPVRFTEYKSPITIRAPSRSPYPAITRFVYFGPKSFHLLIILGLTLFVTACASEPRIITRTELVEVEVCEGAFREIPPELVDNVPIQAIPAGATWRQLVELLIVDRANLKVANGRLTAIRNLDGNE